MQRILRLGGVIAGVILIAFGIGSIVLGMNARDTVSTELSRENIVGTPDMNPADTKTALEEAATDPAPHGGVDCDCGVKVAGLERAQYEVRRPLALRSCGITACHMVGSPGVDGL